jgi:N-acyl-L-homoserine lactone synthetase
MIRLIQGKDSANYPFEMDEMFRARAAVFGKRLGWNVEVVENRESDSYDQENPLYLVCVDEASGDVIGSTRLLPTTGPNMFRDCFSHLFDEPIDISSPLIWECTRFCMHPFGKSGGSIKNAMRVSWELHLGICEVGLLAGVSQIQAVYDQFMVKVYRRVHWSPEPMAQSKRFGKLPVYVGLWDVSAEALAEMRRESGIVGSILENIGAVTLGKVA